jgi:hypothetical protein
LFDVELGLDKRSEDGFENGSALGIKQGIRSMLGVRLGIGTNRL